MCGWKEEVAIDCSPHGDGGSAGRECGSQQADQRGSDVVVGLNVATCCDFRRKLRGVSDGSKEARSIQRPYSPSNFPPRLIFVAVT